MSKVILIGLTPQGLSLLRLLARNGYEVFAFSNTARSVGFKSKFGHKHLFKDVDDLKQKIVSVVKQGANRVQCIITSGELLAMVVAEFPELYDICDVQSGPLSLIQTLARKDLMYDYAEKRGLKSAKYLLLSDYKAGSLRFPVIVKRNFEVPLFFKVKKIDNEDSLRELISHIPIEVQANVIIQEFISLNTCLNISFQGYFKNGQLLASFLGNQKRRLRTGITSYLEEATDERLASLIHASADQLFKESDYHGFFELEFLYSPESEELFFIEINTRACGLQSAFVAKYKNLYRVFENNINKEELHRRPERLCWVNLTRDFRARFQNSDLKGLKNSLIANKDVFDWKDPRPFFYQFFR